MALVASLALNGFFIGMLVADALKPRRGFTGERMAGVELRRIDQRLQRVLLGVEDIVRLANVAGRLGDALARAAVPHRALRGAGGAGRRDGDQTSQAAVQGHAQVGLAQQ